MSTAAVPTEAPTAAKEKAPKVEGTAESGNSKGGAT